MKFKDLPIGTKFLDDIEINIFGYSSGLIKVSETEYNYTDTLNSPPIEWLTDDDDDVYPILEWEDEVF